MRRPTVSLLAAAAMLRSFPSPSSVQQVDSSLQMDSSDTGVEWGEGQRGEQ